jgi:hypothetical protein
MRVKDSGAEPSRNKGPNQGPDSSAHRHIADVMLAGGDPKATSDHRVGPRKPISDTPSTFELALPAKTLDGGKGRNRGH